MFSSSPLPGDECVLDVVASTSLYPAKGIVSTVATVPTSWVTTRSESGESVRTQTRLVYSRCIDSDSNAQLQLSGRVCLYVAAGEKEKKAISKIMSLCAVSVRAAVLCLVVDEEAGGVVGRTALGWILASPKKRFPPGVVKN